MLIIIPFLCSRVVCHYDVKHNDKAILCTSCDNWVHIKCNGITIEEYKTRMKSNRDNPILIENDEWICLKCITDERASIFPFGILNNFEIINLNSFDSIYLSEQVPEFDIFSDAINTNNLDNSNDIDENIVHSINSRYYSCQEFFKINCNSNSLKLYHTNVNGFSCHVDTLRDFLVQCDTDFDAICISETSYQLDNAISNNDLLKNYSTPFVTNTKSSKLRI